MQKHKPYPLVISVSPKYIRQAKMLPPHLINAVIIPIVSLVIWTWRLSNNLWQFNTLFYLGLWLLLLIISALRIILCILRTQILVNVWCKSTFTFNQPNIQREILICLLFESWCRSQRSCAHLSNILRVFFDDKPHSCHSM